eukprot:scaffold48105_cov30-Attheya_sp.AAC.4
MKIHPRRWLHQASGGCPWLLRGVPIPPPNSCSAVPAPEGCTCAGRAGDGLEQTRGASLSVH